MSLVLFDAPGPRARRRVTIWSAVAGVVIAALLVLAAVRLNQRGIFDADRWDIFTEDTATWEALFRRGLLATLRAAALATVIAMPAGALLAIARMSESRWVRSTAAVWIEAFRGLPVVLLMFFLALGFDFSIFNAVVGGLVLYNTAVFAEILRAGLLSLPGGQREAALAIGLTTGQALRLILLPQAIRRMLPSLVSQVVVLLKDTSLGFIVGYVELLRVNRELRDFFGSRYIFSLFLVTAVIYIGVNFALSRVAVYLERRGTAKAAGGVSTMQGAAGADTGGA
ncbi:MAG TPA: amino acid ABC transporter permease [Actinomycetes bacterium]|nr:amino acid ABC transporter permease [Actinomycetes bacterium]